MSCHQLVDSLVDGKLDLALLPAQLNLHSEKLFQESILSDQLAFFASPGSPFIAKELVSSNMYDVW